MPPEFGDIDRASATPLWKFGQSIVSCEIVGLTDVLLGESVMDSSIGGMFHASVITAFFVPYEKIPRPTATAIVR